MKRRCFLGLVLSILAMPALCLPSAQAGAPTPFEICSVAKPANKVDEAVFLRLATLNLAPADVCSDPVFVRRVYLDVIGTLPTGAQARDFILDRNPEKRRFLIDRLLERDEFADLFAMKWSDLLRIKAEFPINLWPNAAQAYHRWVRDCIRTNVTYDRFVRELLTASGSNFEVPPVNFYRAMQDRSPEGIAKTVALTFMGERAENWPSNRLANLAVFFANVGYKSTGEWKEQIVFFDPASTNASALNGCARHALLPDGTEATLAPDQDPRVVFADWLLDSKNPRLARNLANRAWSWLLGRGIIHEPDDIRPDNPAVNPELLVLLEGEFVTSGYDFRHLVRLVLNSKTYQLSCIPNTTDVRAVANFACYPLRRLEAEVLIDAIDQLTGSTENYSSAIPEPYTFIPDNLRTIALPDASISSSFLELFGRPPRDTGLESERNNRLTAAQKLWLLNSSTLLRKIEQSRMVQFQAASEHPVPEVITGMYLGIVSRFPTTEEQKATQAYFQKPGRDRKEAVVDLAWALLNSSEFLYRH